jgi:hypothetical protein
MHLFLEGGNPLTQLPSWDTIYKQYGPFLGLSVGFLFIVLFLQWWWYRSNVKDKKEEIARLVKRTTELENVNLKLITQLRSKGK